MPIAPNQLKQLVVKSGLLDEPTFNSMLDVSIKTDTPIIDLLVQRGIASDQQLGQMIADFYQVPFADLSQIDVAPEVLSLIPERVARKLTTIVFANDQEGVKVATTEIGDTQLSELLSKKTGRQVFIYYATEKEIKKTFKYYKRDLQKSFDRLLQEGLGTYSDGLADPPIEKIVDLLIEVAYFQEASDIHIEPQEKQTIIRFRIDGILHDVLLFPRQLHDRVVTRIKVLSRLRTDEHLSAQDGKMTTQSRGERLDLRVSIIPISDGEKIVMRLLSSKLRSLTLSDLGMNEQDLAKVTRAYSQAHGMILSTGPTGSGKTTSIYSILKILNIREKNVTTIEDPTEYRIAGANQVQVNTKTNLTFAKGLRSILRQDPDYVFVGEIRDSETAGIAVNAAMTGHLVLSTLHTNDAATAIPRLIDMGVEPFLVASTTNLIFAQRLVRKICDHCKFSYTMNKQDLYRYFPQASVDAYFPGEVTMYQGKGCKVCHNTGYSGRLGIFEILEVSKSIRQMISERRDADEIGAQARREGMRLMFEDGLGKIVAGNTTIEEVLRVTTTG